MISPAVGEPAPDFTLPGTTGDGGPARDYHLADPRGHDVELVFYPGDNTPVCTVQLRTYTEDFSQFDALGATVWAMSPQDIDSHEDFAARQGGFGFPLLADVDKEVGRAYNILGPLGFYRRSVFVVDAAGVIRYAHRAASGLTFRPTAELVEAVRKASA
jgi:peroxiredoxin Q/BCP